MLSTTPVHRPEPPAPLTAFLVPRAPGRAARLLCPRPPRRSSLRRKIALAGRVLADAGEARELARPGGADSPLLLVLAGGQVRLVGPSPPTVRETAELLEALEDLTPPPAAQ